MSGTFYATATATAPASSSSSITAAAPTGSSAGGSVDESQHLWQLVCQQPGVTEQMLWVDLLMPLFWKHGPHRGFRLAMHDSSMKTELTQQMRQYLTKLWSQSPATALASTTPSLPRQVLEPVDGKHVPTTATAATAAVVMQNTWPSLPSVASSAVHPRRHVPVSAVASAVASAEGDQVEVAGTDSCDDVGDGDDFGGGADDGDGGGGDDDTGEVGDHFDENAQRAGGDYGSEPAEGNWRSTSPPPLLQQRHQHQQHRQQSSYQLVPTVSADECKRTIESMQACRCQLECKMIGCPRVHGTFDKNQELEWSKQNTVKSNPATGHKACRNYLRAVLGTKTTAAAIASGTQPPKVVGCHSGHACTWRHFENGTVRPLTQLQLSQLGL